MNLLRGLPGHPLHPPLTDATIGIYSAATAFCLLSVLGVSDGNTARAWWLALVLGLVVTVPTALTGLAEWLALTPGGEPRRTATLHLTAMVSATVLFLVAAVVGHGGYAGGEVTAGGLVLTLVAYGTMALGGWLGGTLVFVHGARVLNLRDEPVERAAAPIVHPEKEVAAGPRV